MANKISINLQNYKDKSGGRVPPGRYIVVIDDIEETQTRNNDPMLNVYLRVSDGEYQDSTIVDRLLPEHEKALFRVVNFLQALGFKTPRKKLEFDLDKMIGRTVEIDADDGEPYMGRVKSEVRGYNRVAQPVQRDLSDLEEDSTEDNTESEEDVDLDTVDLG